MCKHYKFGSGLESDTPLMCISLDNHRGEGYTMAVYQNIYRYHFRESTFINKIACMVNILSSPIRP